MKKIQSIIQNYFDIDFLWGLESNKTQMIKSLALDFEVQHGHVVKNVLQKVRSRYPDVNMMRYTYFVEDDRGFTFELTRTGHDPVIVAISIFGYFVSWALKINQEGYYRDYIEKGDDPLVDDVFRDIVNPEMDNALEWASKELLMTEIEEFNIDKIRGLGSSPIYVGNLLTRF